MEDIKLLTYLLVFALSVVFSMFSVDRKSAVFSFLSMVTWFTLGICHLALSQASMFIVIAWLFTFLGFFFMVYGFALILLTFQTRREKEESEIFELP